MAGGRCSLANGTDGSFVQRPGTVLQASCLAVIQLRPLS